MQRVLRTATASRLPDVDSQLRLVRLECSVVRLQEEVRYLCERGDKTKSNRSVWGVRLALVKGAELRRMAMNK
jgi:hypothetical protein